MNKTTLNSQKEKHSMLSLRRATRPGQRLQSVTGFLSTLSLRRATFQGPGLVRHGVDFYPRSPCGERPRSRKISTRPCQFLSTLSLRRATGRINAVCLTRLDFYPRSPCGERRQQLAHLREAEHVFLSTLSLRRATRDRLCVICDTDSVFLSTLSLRRATAAIISCRSAAPVISIHALLAESDSRSCSQPTSQHVIFLSTLSLRRATSSINGAMSGLHSNFYPRSPCGERPCNIKALDLYS